MTRAYDANGEPIYCDGSGAAPAHIHKYAPYNGTGVCAVCHVSYHLTKKSVVRKHFADQARVA